MLLAIIVIFTLWCLSVDVVYGWILYSVMYSIFMSEVPTSYIIVHYYIIFADPLLHEEINK